MCRSAADGGQRCFSHAWSAYRKAMRQRDRLDPQDLKRPDADFRVHATLVDLASTPKGADWVRKQYRESAAGSAVKVYYDSVLRQGVLIADRKRALGAAGRSEQKRGLLARAPQMSPEERAMRESLRQRSDERARTEQRQEIAANQAVQRLAESLPVSERPPPMPLTPLQRAALDRHMDTFTG